MPCCALFHDCDWVRVHAVSCAYYNGSFPTIFLFMYHLVSLLQISCWILGTKCDIARWLALPLWAMPMASYVTIVPKLMLLASKFFLSISWLVFHDLLAFSSDSLHTVCLNRLATCNVDELCNCTKQKAVHNLWRCMGGMFLCTCVAFYVLGCTVVTCWVLHVWRQLPLQLPFLLLFLCL